MDLARRARTCLIALAAAGSVAAAPSAYPPLTSAGFGGVKIGMRERDAVRVLGLKTPHDDISSFECRELTWPGHPEVAFMARNGRISRISLYGKSPLNTDRGFSVGSREADIKRAYGPGLKIEPHAYEDEPAHYLTFWDPGGKRGVRYETS
ncbi:MAG: hypothetical protein ACREE0_06695, partial [Phenylobacterium sp.]